MSRAAPRSPTTPAAAASPHAPALPGCCSRPHCAPPAPPGSTRPPSEPASAAAPPPPPRRALHPAAPQPEAQTRRGPALPTALCQAHWAHPCIAGATLPPDAAARPPVAPAAGWLAMTPTRRASLRDALLSLPFIAASSDSASFKPSSCDSLRASGLCGCARSCSCASFGGYVLPAATGRLALCSAVDIRLSGTAAARC
ncbi:hypothetical protein DL89DRAFT_136512 [Linderina pennispora]|uniref:Uncharacterized protein n=1 Tax=Linderina pennispora TaxID=61395 RepID=A0A1Y1WAQ3_9FUNG|nr:uncharacterized protein DL89DRAFT_136512 [Linderina pennispora]ORX70611.1 hypothetical protein DL89DRAFT_136512 [Linderina pennispora]